MELCYRGNIKICSTIDNLDECGLVESSEKNEQSFPAESTEWADGHTTISYREVDGENAADALITVTPDTVTVKREGAISSEFIFRVGFTQKTLYSIPPFSFDAEIAAKKIRGQINGGEGELTIIYDMTVGGAKKSIRMKITLTKEG